MGSLERCQAGTHTANSGLTSPCSLISGARSPCFLISTAAAGPSLKELSLQAENKQNNKFSRKICAFPQVLFVEWEERNLTQDTWDFRDKCVFCTLLRGIRMSS